MSEQVKDSEGKKPESKQAAAAHGGQSNNYFKSPKFEGATPGIGVYSYSATRSDVRIFSQSRQGMQNMLAIKFEKFECIISEEQEFDFATIKPQRFEEELFVPEKLLKPVVKAAVVAPATTKAQKEAAKAEQQEKVNDPLKKKNNLNNDDDDDEEEDVKDVDDENDVAAGDDDDDDEEDVQATIDAKNALIKERNKRGKKSVDAENAIAEQRYSKLMFEFDKEQLQYRRDRRSVFGILFGQCDTSMVHSCVKSLTGKKSRRKRIRLDYGKLSSV